MKVHAMDLIEFFIIIVLLLASVCFGYNILQGKILKFKLRV